MTAIVIRLQQWWREGAFAGRVAPFLLLFSMLFPAAGRSQVIHDFAEIDSDVLIVGHSYSVKFSRLAVMDLNNNGGNDLFFGGWSGGGEGQIIGIFDQLFYHNLIIDPLVQGVGMLIYGKPDISVGEKMIRCDINADGIDDLALCDSRHGTVYVLFGSDHWKDGTELNLAKTKADLTITGAYNLGYDMTSADLNGDGLDDLIIGAYNALNPIGWSTGAAYVFFAGPQYTSPMTIDLASEPADITIFGADGNDNLGQDLTTGDVNGDGIKDLIVGADTALYSQDKLGRVYVFFGCLNWPANHQIDLASEVADITIIGPDWGSALGTSVASGDINGDGIDDILTGASSYDGPPQSRGICYAIYGRTSFSAGQVFDMRSAPADLTCLGEAYMNFLGHGMSVGDLDGDGLAEWVVTSANISGSEDFDGTGQGYVIAGSDAFPSTHVIDLSIHQPTMKILSEGKYHELSAYDNKLRDLNGDGIDDLIIAAPGASLPDRPFCGKIHIIFGHAPLNDPPRVLAGPGPDAANRPEARLYDPFDSDQWLLRLTPYLVQGYGAVTTTADLNGDGYDRMVMGPGPGPYHPPLVTLFHDDGELETSFLAYGTPRFGVNLAAGDLDGNGIDEIITGAGPGEVFGPHVRAWRYAAGSVTPMTEVSFMAYGTLRWGVNVACGDLDGDGREEIVTGAGPGDIFGPHVRAWRLSEGKVRPVPQVSYLAYGTNKYGVNVACGDIDGDGMDEIVTGPGPSELFGSHVRGWNYDGQTLTPISGVSFIAYPGSLGDGGVVVACGNIDNDGYDEILTTPGPLADNPPWLKSWNYDGDAISLAESKSFMVFEEGDFVAGANIALGNFFEPADYLP